jgi:hypothetical protein
MGYWTNSGVKFRPFWSTTVTAVRRHSVNNRIDYKRAAHSFYGSGGLFYGTITRGRGGVLSFMRPNAFRGYVIYILYFAGAQFRLRRYATFRNLP